MNIKSLRHLDKQTKVASWGTVEDAAFQDLNIHRDTARRFELGMTGRVVWPWEQSYDKARQQADPAFQEYPAVIVYCESFVDVRMSIQAAHQQGWRVACRSGGHSTAGFSVNTGGIVIDVSGLNHVQVDAASKRARIGPGAQWGTIDKVLDAYRLHVPGGGCPGVCMAGYMQGGGYGFTSREFGMNCDRVIEVLVMLADGSVVRANESQNTDLLWAVKGGTGGNFGVLLEATFQLVDLWKLWGFRVRWDLKDAAEVLAKMQSDYTRSGASPKLGYQSVIMTEQGQTEAGLITMGMYNGSESEGMAAIRPLLDIGPGRIQTQSIDTYCNLNKNLMVEPNVPTGWTLPPKEIKQAGYIASPVGVSGWQEIVDYYIGNRPNQVCAVVIESYGGAISSTPPESSAFVHRDVDMDIDVDAFWNLDSERQEAVDYLNGYMEVLARYFNGHSYQNYPRRDLPNYRWAYWGQAFPRLLRVKQKYDPEEFFWFPQGISLPEDEGERARFDGIPLTECDEPIVYETRP